MKYYVTIKFNNGHDETFTITSSSLDEVLERTIVLAMENLGYWFNISYVDCFEIRPRLNEDE